MFSCVKVSHISSKRGLLHSYILRADFIVIGWDYNKLFTFTFTFTLLKIWQITIGNWHDQCYYARMIHSFKVTYKWLPEDCILLLWIYYNSHHGYLIFYCSQWCMHITYSRSYSHALNNISKVSISKILFIV